MISVCVPVHFFWGREEQALAVRNLRGESGEKRWTQRSKNLGNKPWEQKELQESSRGRHNSFAFRKLSRASRFCLMNKIRGRAF